jgi:hypothetical protein
MWGPSILLTLAMHGLDFLGYYCQLGKQLTHSKPFANIFRFVDVIYELCNFFTFIKTNPWPSYAMHMTM